MSILEKIIEMPGFLPVVGTLGGALIAGLSAYGINKTNKESEEKKHNNNLIFNSSLEQWREHIKFSSAEAKKGISIPIMPYDSFVINSIVFSKILNDGVITKNNVVSKLKKAYEISEKADTYILTNKDE